MRTCRTMVILSCLLAAFLTHAKPLLIGIPNFIPPFVMTIDNKGGYVGFDIDLINEICKRISEPCHFQSLDYNNMLKGVRNHTLDLAIGYITITPDLQKLYLFSLPYLPSFAQYVVQKESPFHTREALQGKTIGIYHGTLFWPVLINNFNGDVIIKNYPNVSSLILGLTSGEVDAVLMHSAIAESLYANNDNLRLLGHKQAVGLGYGIAAAKDQEALIIRINQALLNMESDGTYLEIYNLYFGDMTY